MKIRRDYPVVQSKSKSVSVTVYGGEQNFCEYCTGYRTDGNGNITPSRTFAKLCTIGNDFDEVYYFPHINNYIGVTENHDVYRVNKLYDIKDNAEFKYAESFYEYPVSAVEITHEIDDCPRAVFFGGGKILTLNMTVQTTTEFGYYIFGTCLHMGRVFAADFDDKYKIRWSETGIFNWKQSADGSGFVQLNPARGAVHRVFSLGGKLVAIRDYGIDVISAYGDPRLYAVVRQNNGPNTEPLVFDACAVCGNKVFFCSQNEIYYYDGNDSVRIDRVKLPPHVKISTIRKLMAFDGRYVMVNCTNEADGKDWWLEIDISGGTFGFFAQGFRTVLKSKYGYTLWNDGSIYAEADKIPDDASGGKKEYDHRYIWRSREIDLGVANGKTLKSVAFKGSGDLKLCVTADGEKRTFDNFGVIPVNLCARKFVFEMSGCGTPERLECRWEVTQ